MTYLNSRPERFIIDRGYMDMNEFLMLLEDSKLVGSSGGDGDHDLLTMKEVRQAFAGSQDDVIVAANKARDTSTSLPPLTSGNGGGGTQRNLFAVDQQKSSSSDTKTSSAKNIDQASNNQSLLLSFPEFLEAVLRLALLKWDDDSYSITEKLTMAIDAINNNCLSSSNTSGQTANNNPPPLPDASSRIGANGGRRA
mmetsp:Transcript_11575/g.17266  ORF Transcript_11575/g.17266 Transcript_11575/m.17266 type:complete len:196 (-) Transcript_11575:1557-2144(-)